MATKPSREDILAKAKAKLAQSPTATTPTITVAPTTISTAQVTMTPVFDPSASFWCAHNNHTVYLPGNKEIKFLAYTYTTKDSDEVRQLREMTRLYPHKFKEM
jgi:hypothetical protein